MATKKTAGYALFFHQQYEVGDFVESVDPKAFRNTDMSNVMALRDHNFSLLLGRRNGKDKKGTLRLAVDKVGLIFEVSMPDSALGAETIELIERGDLAGCSWGFQLAPDGSQWRYSNGKTYRTLTDVRTLFDVSFCSWPANDQTACWVSSGDIPGKDWQTNSTQQPDFSQRQKQVPTMEARSKFTMAPQYETASLIMNEARQAVVNEARRFKQQNEPENWQAQHAARMEALEIKKADNAASLARHLAEERERSIDRSPEGIADRVRRHEYAQKIAWERSQPVKYY